ncbi:hypothetical protein ROZALSC1DRAFT_7517, partial [Rozella allomycis CSF55]
FNLRFGVLDKLKSDFNDKRDRCVQIRQLELLDSEMWSEVMKRLSELILACFGFYIMNMEDEVKKIEAQKSLPGWNFCSYFSVKESMALNYISMKMFDESLIIYEELDA